MNYKDLFDDLILTHRLSYEAEAILKLCEGDHRTAVEMLQERFKEHRMEALWKGGDTAQRVEIFEVKDGRAFVQLCAPDPLHIERHVHGFWVPISTLDQIEITDKDRFNPHGVNNE